MGVVVSDKSDGHEQTKTQECASAEEINGVTEEVPRAVLNWARGRNVAVLQLTVTSNNEPAISFYKPLGFTQNGQTEPDPNDPVVIQVRQNMIFRPSGHLAYAGNKNTIPLRPSIPSGLLRLPAASDQYWAGEQLQSHR